MTDEQLTHEVKTFDANQMYVNGYDNPKRYSLRADGTLVCKPHAGGWTGKVVWTGNAPYYYEIRFKAVPPAHATVMVRPYVPKQTFDEVAAATWDRDLVRQLIRSVLTNEQKEYIVAAFNEAMSNLCQPPKEDS